MKPLLSPVWSWCLILDPYQALSCAPCGDTVWTTVTSSTTTFGILWFLYTSSMYSFFLVIVFAIVCICSSIYISIWVHICICIFCMICNNYFQVSYMHLLLSSMCLSPILDEKLQKVPSQVFGEKNGFCTCFALWERMDIAEIVRILGAQSAETNWRLSAFPGPRPRSPWSSSSASFAPSVASSFHGWGSSICASYESSND